MKGGIYRRDEGRQNLKAPRKLDVLIKFYKETISNTKISHRTRMSAAARLDDLYARHLLMEEKAAARKERYEARAAAQRGREGGIPAQESALDTSEDARLDAVFGSLLRRKVGDADTDTAE